MPNAGDPYGTRTHVTTVKGWCLNRLTNGPYLVFFVVLVTRTGAFASLKENQRFSEPMLCILEKDESLNRLTGAP